MLEAFYNNLNIWTTLVYFDGFRLHVDKMIATYFDKINSYLYIYRWKDNAWRLGIVGKFERHDNIVLYPYEYYYDENGNYSWHVEYVAHPRILDANVISPQLFHADLDLDVIYWNHPTIGSKKTKGTWRSYLKGISQGNIFIMGYEYTLEHGSGKEYYAAQPNSGVVKVGAEGNGDIVAPCYVTLNQAII